MSGGGGGGGMGGGSSRLGPSRPLDTIVIIPLARAYVCADLDCQTVSNLHECPVCGSGTVVLARALAEKKGEEKSR